MINESLTFLAAEVNKYLNLRYPQPGNATNARLVVGNIASAGDTNAGTPPATAPKTAMLSLVNIEEDRVARIQENTVKTATSTLYKSPPVIINLYILFSMNKEVYSDSLNLLSGIILFFQHQNVFTPVTHPALDSRIPKLTADLYTMSFEQVNHLWSIMGGKYMPSVMYKVRQLIMQEDMVSGESGLIREIILNNKTKLPVT